MMSAAELLSDKGPLAAGINGFTARLQQQEMAAAIEAALHEGSSLICEAGTGTGKTFAYLVPVLASGKKVIISTGTKHLQDQLFQKDLPVVREALKTSVAAVLLKGRNNYLCLYRLHLIETEGRVAAKKIIADSFRIRRWSGTTRTGDLNELTFLPEDAPVRSLVTSTVENCLGQSCDYFDDCFVFQARRQAREADVVIVNHHLLLADMGLREQGFGELLAMPDSIIFDEAHQLPELASTYFSQSLGSRQLFDLVEDAKVAIHEEAPDMPELNPVLDTVEKAVRDLRLAFGLEDCRITWAEIKDESALAESTADMLNALQALLDCLHAVAERGRLLENCWRRSQTLFDFIESYSNLETGDYVQWVEIRGKSFVLNRTPVDIASTFQSRLNSYEANTIFTSATLAVDRDFSHFANQLGLEKMETRVWGSPFDYQQQSLLYLPQGMPDPRNPDFIDAFVQVAVHVLQLSRGRAFLLFTSHLALKVASTLLADRIDFPVFIQGSAPRSELLDSFRNTRHAVLLGTSSFWEGVDVKGQALSCVIIDKLPFASPDDPVLQARISYMARQGRNPFMEYQLPQAVIGLKQGVGRLIRDASDYGVLVICDPRLSTKSYGRRFINGLPALPVTRDIGEVADFFVRKEM